MSMQNADVAPTANQIEVAGRARTQATEVMARWTRVKTTGVAGLNAKLKAAGQPVIVVPK
jgi:hypothetical protein